MNPAAREALRAIERIGKQWALGEADRAKLLGSASLGEPGPDVLDRIGHIVAIYNALHLIFEDTFADAWVHRSNAAFGGARPIDVLLDRDVMRLVAMRRYLETATYE